MDNPLKKQLKQLIIDKLGLEDIIKRTSISDG